MPAALAAKLAVVAIAQQRVVVGIGFQVDVTAVSAVAARGASARNELFPAKRDATVSAVAGLHQDFGFVNKHRSLDARKRRTRAYVTGENKTRIHA